VYKVHQASRKREENTQIFLKIFCSPKNYSCWK